MCVCVCGKLSWIDGDSGRKKDLPLLRWFFFWGLFLCVWDVASGVSGVLGDVASGGESGWC